MKERLSLKYRLLRDEAEGVRHTQSIDISNGGMSFRSSEFLSRETPVLVEFTPPHQDGPIRFSSEVVHARKHAGANHYVIGVKFDHVLK